MISSYYYNGLSGDKKIIYDLIFSGINSLEEKILLPLVESKELHAIFNFVLYDNPILFYTRTYRYSMDISNQFSVLAPIYKYDNTIIDQSADLLNDFLKTFDVVKNDSDIEKELFVHDFCLDNIRYDYDFNEYAFSILGAIVHGKAVCEGISKFVKVALNYLGVDCILTSGEAFNLAHSNSKAEPHMWNVVSISGELYHLDVTFNISQTDKIHRYDYFNLSDREIEKDHIISDVIPSCVVSDNDYYSLNLQVVNGLSEMDKYIKEEMRKKNKNVIFKLRNTCHEPNIIEKIMNIVSMRCQSLFNFQNAIAIRYNPSQYIFEIMIS